MKSNETKKRKSGFNPNRTCYLTADGQYYCYERWDDLPSWLGDTVSAYEKVSVGIRKS